MEDDELSSGIQMANAYAVIIGIGKYKDPTIPTLRYTHVDANDLYDVLINPRRIGIQKENIKLLLNEDATLQNIKSTVGTWLLRKADEDSTVIIFFSGHGGVEPDPSGSQAKYLLPWDTWRDDLYATAISSRDFEGLLQRIKSNRLVMFLDACHSGGVISREGTKDVVTIENLCADLAAGSGRAIIAASQGSQQSFEDDKLGHGIFAHHLLEALKGRADTDRDGKITLTDTFNYLGREVPKTARELAGAVQEPMMRSDLTKDIVLAIDLDRLEKIRKEKEQAEQEAKTREEKGKLLRWWSERKLSTEQYDKALKVYEADDALLDERDRRIKELTHELLAEKLAIDNYVFSVNIILGTAEKSAAPKAAEKAAIEEPIAEEARKAQEAAEHKAREEAEAKEKARREVEKKPAQAEKPAPVIKKIVRKGWFRAVASVFLVVSIGVAALLLFGRAAPPPIPPPAPPTPTPATVVTFRDSNIEAVIKSAIGKAIGDPIIDAQDLDGFYSLSVMRRDITDLTGLEYCTDLNILELPRNLISDISALSSLTKLKTLHLEGNLISDISPLSSLTKLTTLYLEGNRISDISPLSSLTKLTTLHLDGNQISDISALSSLTHLKDLWLGENQISDISALSSLTYLNTLYLNENYVNDISALSSLTYLKDLYLEGNRISDISALSSLTNLRWVHLSENQISDISSLVRNSELGRADILSIVNNNLDLSEGSDDLENIRQLKGRGVMVSY